MGLKDKSSEAEGFLESCGARCSCTMKKEVCLCLCPLINWLRYLQRTMNFWGCGTSQIGIMDVGMNLPLNLNSEFSPGAAYLRDPAVAI